MALSSNATKEVLAMRMRAYTLLENEDEAFRDLDTLLSENAVDILPELFNTFDKFRRLEEFVPILERQWQSFKEIKSEDINSTIRELTSTIIHMAFHAMENNDHTKLKQYSIMLGTLKQKITEEQMLKSFIHYLAEFFRGMKYGIVIKMIRNLNEIFGEQDGKVLQPIADALDFIQTKDTDILEGLHKENRDLVVDVIKSISKDAVIPLTVYDSLYTANCI